MGPGYSSTSLEASQANTLAAVKAEVAKLNDASRSGYLNATFHNWALSVTAGRDPGDHPPQPPMAYEVGYFNDPTTGPGTVGPYGGAFVRWAYPKLGTTPVCAMPPIPPFSVVEASAWKIGIAIPGGGGVWFQALTGDTTPTGATRPGISKDGVHGLFRKVGFPMGDGWFEKIG